MGNNTAENIIGLQHERCKGIIQELTIMSDIFMRNVLKQAACTELVLQVIMENKELHILEHVIQMDYKNLQGRSVELDCLARDSEDRRYDIEFENSNKRAKPKRARYYGGMIDMNTLEPGQEFESLPETYVIWITEKDVLKETPKGVAEMCKELEELYADGRAEGREEGKAEGRTEGIGDSIKALMGNVKCTLEQAMDMLGIAVDSRDIYRKMLQNNK